jgi:hypothetical protein
MANTYTFISSITVGSGGAASATFSSIPQTYSDLHIVFSPHTDRAGYINSDMALSINGSTSLVTQRAVYSSGTGANSSTGVQALFQGGYNGIATGQSFVFGPTTIYIPNYTSSVYKSLGVDFTAEGNTSDRDQARNGISTLLWSSNSAITSISIAPTSGNFVQYSTFYLYGIKNS